ncbi:MAG: amidohydrolase family protein [bacterium]|nr:amidohydrolase family protein [Acidimicrobiia bacterium]MCY4649680.1 amidohydrolase family protein [bacterium]
MSVVSARRVFGSNGWVEDASVEITDGWIETVSAGGDRPGHAYLIPAYVDLQVTGFRDIDLATTPPSGWSRIGDELAGHGVTSWLPTLVSRPLAEYPRWLEGAAQVMSLQNPGVARILGVHLEGPWLGSRAGAHLDLAAGSVNVNWIKELPNHVKVVTLAPERSGALDAIDELRALNIVAALGHTDADHQTATAAFDQGATLLTHCFNANPPLHHRSPGILGAALARDDVFVSLIADGVHVHPDVIRITIRAKGPDRVALISDASGWERGVLGSQPTQLIDGAPRLADGSLAGSAITLDQAVRFVVNHCGISLHDAVRSASTVPANIINRPDLGRIEPGARADVVALDEQLRVSAVWMDGIRVR